MTPGVTLRLWHAIWSANGPWPRYRLLHASQQRLWKPSSSAKGHELRDGGIGRIARRQLLTVRM
jgi:hypothetical protein